MRIRNILAVLAAVAVLGGHMSWQSLDRLHLTWLDWNATVGDALGNGKTPTTVAGVLKYHAASLNAFPHCRALLISSTRLRCAPRSSTMLVTKGESIFLDNGSDMCVALLLKTVQYG
ncbi:hypothetical protein J5F27_12715 [Schleiferilactobacillus harbinensis]|jgi:hypothetical protein|uniref:hypothetical protein n=1 Tax=Schleiferilactobacillus harbinensis TaxID=304207 RepID=UPI001AB01647|nr:hypothetical protein [Schleiferilactobacillus harbinensis]MBO3092772.1 hypothetical protein [Schleiferilactobacillus harbinensis]